MKKRFFHKKNPVNVAPVSAEHQEHDTECDLCIHKDCCIKHNLLVSVANPDDVRPHYVRGMCVFCPFEEDRKNGI